ncbi:NAD-dependent epimerase/dehydratase family protein [Exiguobacterium sp. SH5S13]|uniref:NAD-dependent epimerase/dehydratase family protein n=1 Tax=Exiguobacterium sp. SH5S13 TaxID=2510959 RepID=UPI00103964A1|nr:NAD-dependent epimerase/dehydratase family protein [Exiguobacterium sp. SH5S13]TCI49915.1 NAD-dependent epimerase/dehydratase family protein [Exiguobacterium sp. SH5S13]
MKRVLITGITGFVGNSCKRWIEEHYKEQIHVDTVGMRDGAWRQRSFEGYDAILYVAGIAHVSTDKSMEDLYYKVNTELTAEVAAKAKQSGVKQFIFLSSMIVYGDATTAKMITRDTVPNPTNFYGDSKLQAENKLAELADETFVVANVRSPMIYGKGSKGNYVKLAGLAQKVPFFPSYQNKRSMIHIDNLSELLALIVLNEDSGTFHPQNADYVCTSDLVSMIGAVHGNRVRRLGLFNGVIGKLVDRNVTMNKLFGDFAYAKELSVYPQNYHVRDFFDSVVATEKN